MFGSTVPSSLKVIEMLSSSTLLRDKLESNTKYFRKGIQETGLNVLQGDHPIVPVMLGDAVVAQKMAEKLLQEGIYVIGFSYPVVPQGQARIRAQISAAHTKEDLDLAIEKFQQVGNELGIC